MKCEMYSGMRKLRRFVLTEIMYWLYARTGRSTCKDSGADGRRYLAIIGWFPIPLYIISALTVRVPHINSFLTFKSKIGLCCVCLTHTLCTETR